MYDPFLKDALEEVWRDHMLRSRVKQVVPAPKLTRLPRFFRSLYIRSPPFAHNQSRMSWLAELVPPPHTRGPLTLQSFTQDLLPPLICYFVTAVLVVTPKSFPARLALLPISLCSAFRASTRLDLAAGYGDERLLYLNQGLLLAMTILATRVVIWTFQTEPYRRLKAPWNPDAIDPSRLEDSLGPKQTLLDAGDLFFNLRGLGWNWSHGLHIPPETRPTSSRSAFLSVTFLDFLFWMFLWDTFHYSVQWFSPLTIGSPKGGTIFDAAMPPLQRYLRSSVITLLSGATVYCAISTAYLFFTICGVLIFRHDPLQWPPVFHAPWFATSLNDFWSRRWHQIFRDSFVSFGGKPLFLLFGRAGGVLGAFLVSGILHDFGTWGMGNGSDFRCIAGFFIINGIGMILEHTWKRITGSPVGGNFGKLWTLLWLVGWGNMLADAWARKGLVGSVFFPDNIRPTHNIFGSLS